MWASLDLPSRVPQRNPSPNVVSLLTRPNLLARPCPQPTSVFTAARLASHHLTSFSTAACCDFCSWLLWWFVAAHLLRSLPGKAFTSSLVQLVIPLRHTLGPLARSPHYGCLNEPKRDCPVLPIVFISTTHHPLHVTTALQWPSTIVPDASCTHAPTSSPHSRPNTLVAPRCCPPVPPVSVICCRCTTCSQPALTAQVDSAASSACPTSLRECNPSLWKVSGLLYGLVPCVEHARPIPTSPLDPLPHTPKTLLSHPPEPFTLSPCRVLLLIIPLAGV